MRERITLPGAREDRLFFAQVREDPRLEIEALAPAARGTIVLVGSGGCTALSLLAAGAGRVVAVDLNRTQNHLIELKAEAVRRLPLREAIAFLGGGPAAPGDRQRIYGEIRESLEPAARAYWDAHPGALRAGVLRTGVSERLIRAIVLAIRLLIHPPSRIRRLLACRTLEEQRELYVREWNNRRWRALFALLLNRWVFSRTYDPAFFRHVENPSFASHFQGLVKNALTDLPIKDNYFVHQMLTGSYPAGVEGGVPPYLSETGASVVAAAVDRLVLVDGTYTDYLRRCPDQSVDGFALSNICEWLDGAAINALFGEVVRTASPGARLCFRNFVGWTEVPREFRAVVVEDRERGETLIRKDRSAVQLRIAVCRIVKGTAEDAG